MIRPMIPSLVEVEILVAVEQAEIGNMKYIIVERNTIEDLEKAVNEKLEEGWECLGGLSSFFITPSMIYKAKVVYNQAMIKKPYKRSI
jgi:hypothetical protein